MIIRKTISTRIKGIYRDKYEDKKTKALYRVTTYWFLIIPIYQKEEFLD